MLSAMKSRVFWNSKAMVVRGLPWFAPASWLPLIVPKFDCWDWQETPSKTDVLSSKADSERMNG